MIRITAGYGGALAALFIWFGVTSTAFGQTGSIAGTIVDSETGETLIGANVVVDGTSSGSTTDLDGDYVVRSLEPGTYTLGFSYIGYSSKTVTGVDVRAGETSRIDLTLAPEAIGLDDPGTARRDGRWLYVERRAGGRQREFRRRPRFRGHVPAASPSSSDLVA